MVVFNQARREEAGGAARQAKYDRRDRELSTDAGREATAPRTRQRIARQNLRAMPGWFGYLMAEE